MAAGDGVMVSGRYWWVMVCCHGDGCWGESGERGGLNEASVDIVLKIEWGEANLKVGEGPNTVNFKCRFSVNFHRT